MTSYEPPTVVPEANPRPAPGSVALRALLGVVLAIGLVGNAFISFADTGSLVLHGVFGGLSLLGVVGLVVLWRRTRR
ncbi:hypothetical protein [Pseudonocardia humida]|uniref:LPXTG-motif cell wall-anchored protein n=1 Tax=Pseudonocardia humida TaxID=2800819 RepID=A0ABT0ZXS4_9PSEU|nr:hypothetical protein [Pseudonocardia humida]MCO1655545.1 hypothetical protein [Pseudonocardia humida]